MSETHLPECPRRISDTQFCICDRLRACEQRVRVEQQVWHWRQGVQAAHDTVASAPLFAGQRETALAAIDALRGES